MLGYVNMTQYRRAVAPLVRAIARGASLPTVQDATPPTDLTFMSVPFHHLEGLFEVFSASITRVQYLPFYNSFETTYDWTSRVDHSLITYTYTLPLYKYKSPTDRFSYFNHYKPSQYANLSYNFALDELRTNGRTLAQEFDVLVYAFLTRGYRGKVLGSVAYVPAPDKELDALSLADYKYNHRIDTGDWLDKTYTDLSLMFKADSHWFNPIMENLMHGDPAVDNEVYTVGPVYDDSDLAGQRLAPPSTIDFDPARTSSPTTVRTVANGAKPFQALAFKTNAPGGVKLGLGRTQGEARVMSPIVLRLRPTFVYNESTNTVVRTLDLNNFYTKHPVVEVVLIPSAFPHESFTAGEPVTARDRSRAAYERWYYLFTPDHNPSSGFQLQ